MTPEEAKTSGRGDRDVTESSSGLGAVVRQMPTWEERCGEYRTENHGKEICCKERQRKRQQRSGGMKAVLFWCGQRQQGRLHEF